MANPTGKGGFGDRPQDINREGLNKRAPQNWQATVKRITDMTREEAIEYVGAKTKIGRLLKELSPNIPIKDALVLVAIIQFGRDPNPRLLATLMDREDGKPNQPISGDPEKPMKVIIEYADNQGYTPALTPSTETNQSEPQEV